MKRCIRCYENTVDFLSISEGATSLGKEFMPDRLFGGVMIGKLALNIASGFAKMIRDENFYDTEVGGSVLKCKSCGAYYVRCHHCYEISYVNNRPHTFDTIKCRHCSINIIVNCDNATIDHERASRLD